MAHPIIIPIKLPSGLMNAFGNISHLPGAFLLDSGTNTSKDSRYSFAGFNPLHTFAATGGFVTIDDHTVIDNPLNALNRFSKCAKTIITDNYLPFSGGLVGFISFEWGTNLGAGGHGELPDLFFGMYDTILTYDHLENTAWITSLGLKDDGICDENLAKQRAEELYNCLNVEQLNIEHLNVKRFNYPPLYGTHPVVSSLTKDLFINGANVLKTAGNLPVYAQKFSSPTYKTAWQQYLNLRSENQAAYAAYLSCGSFHVLSASRTCLIKVNGEDVKLKPTKGCRSRSKDENQNRKNINELRYSEEIQTSHRFMVSDLLKNLYTVCEKVETEEVSAIETDARAHHLVSKISGKKNKLATPLDCLLSVLPASNEARIASLISKIEKVPRNVYTGTIGFMDFSGNATFNSAFRTLVIKDTIGHLHAGSEIGQTTDPEEAFISAQGSANHIFKLCQTKSI